MLFYPFFILEIIFLFFISKVLTRSLSRVFLSITKSQKAAVSLMAILFFPGVVVHELSHLIAAGVLFVPTGEIEFLPKMEADTVKLGSVAIAKTDPARRAIIGFAPVVVGLLIIFGIVYFLTPFSSLESVFGRFWTSQNDEWSLATKILVDITSFYLLFAISNTMFSSQKDLEGTIELLIVFAIISIALYIIGFRVDISVPLYIQEYVLQIMKRINLFLLGPILIDTIIVSLLNCFIVSKRLKAI